MRLGLRDRRGVHCLQRFELPPAAPGTARPPGQQVENDPFGRSPGAVMKSFAREFKTQAQQLTRDLRHRQLIQNALRKYEAVRDRTKAAFQDWPAARQAAAETKWEAVNHLDAYLTEFADKLAARGTK